MRKSPLLIAIAVLIATPVLFWSRTLPWGLPWAVYLYSVGRLLALVGFVLIVLQYVLSSKIRWIEQGIGLDRMFVIHRLSGVVGLALVLLHESGARELCVCGRLGWKRHRGAHDSTGRSGVLSRYGEIGSALLEAKPRCVTICAGGHFLSLCADSVEKAKWQPRHSKDGSMTARRAGATRFSAEKPSRKAAYHPRP